MLNEKTEKLNKNPSTIHLIINDKLGFLFFSTFKNVQNHIIPKIIIDKGDSS